MMRSRSSPSVFDISALSYTVKVKKTQTKVLVDDISFSMRAGEMLGEFCCIICYDDEEIVLY